jgi:hypothetical protein
LCARDWAGFGFGRLEREGIRSALLESHSGQGSRAAKCLPVRCGNNSGSADALAWSVIE